MTRGILRRLWDRILGRRWIAGADWGYKDEWGAQVIGYVDRNGIIHITEEKTWKCLLP
jgi:hypothetical protein